MFRKAGCLLPIPWARKAERLGDDAARGSASSQGREERLGDQGRSTGATPSRFPDEVLPEYRFWHNQPMRQFAASRDGASRCFLHSNGQGLALACAYGRECNAMLGAGTKSPRGVLRLLNQSLVRPGHESSSTTGSCSWGRIAQTPCHIRHYDALSTYGADPPSSIKELGPLTFNPNQTNFWPTSQPQSRPDRVGQREARVGKVAINAENVAAANPRLGRKLPLERH